MSAAHDENMPPEFGVRLEIGGAMFPIETKRSQREAFTSGADHACFAIAAYLRANPGTPPLTGDPYDFMEILKTQEEEADKAEKGHPLAMWTTWKGEGYEPPVDLQDASLRHV
jgi:hypothetical protein